MHKPINILQLTDFHVFGNKQTNLLNLNPYHTLVKTVEAVKNDCQKKNPALILLTGDLSQDFSLASYDVVKEVFATLNYPMAAIPGNHDDPNLFYDTLSGLCQKNFTFNNWRILLLDTCWPGHVSGFLSQNELIFLEQSLAKDTQTPVLIFLHHHVLPVNSLWLDKIGLKNTPDFLEIIDQYQHVRAVISGHVHQESLTQRNNVNFITTPSTSWQFARNSEPFRLDNLMPGYRWFELNNDNYKTYISRLEYNQNFVPDLDSKGY